MSVRTDFYVPDFEIIIEGQSFRYGSSVDVVSVRITETINQADSFEFTVREHNPKPERFASGELTWLDSHTFDELNKIQVEVGYQGNRAIKLKGKITGFNVTFPESGAPTLTVRGLSQYDELFRATRRKPFEDKTDSEIVSEIAHHLGLSPDVEPTQVKHKLVSPEAATYAAILSERARRLNYEIKVKFDKLIFRRPTYLTDPSPKLTLTWGKDLGSFAPNISTNKMVTRVEVRNTQTAEGGPKQALAGSATASQIRPVLGTKSGLIQSEQKFGENYLLMEEQRLASQAEATSMPRAELERRALEYITGHGSCIGKPELVSRTVVELKGLGQRLSGRYYVTSTTHSIDANGYRTEFEAKRDAI
jgi:phage protein D